MDLVRTSTPLAVSLMILAVFSPTGTSWYDPSAEKPELCGPAEVQMVALLDEAETTRDANRWIVDAPMDSLSMLLWTIGGQPGDPYFLQPWVDIILDSKYQATTEWIGSAWTTYGIQSSSFYGAANYTVEDVENYVLLQNETYVTTRNLTIVASQSIWINGTLLSFSQDEGSSLTFIAPEVHIQGIVATASGQMLTSDYTQKGGMKGGDIHIISPDFQLAEGACIATGDGEDALDFTAFTPSDSTYGEQVQWIGSAGGQGGDLVFSHTRALSNLAGSIYIGNGGAGADVIAGVTAPEVGSAIGGTGGRSGLIFNGVALPMSLASLQGIITGGQGGHGGNAWAAASCGLTSPDDCVEKAMADWIEECGLSYECVLNGYRGMDAYAKGGDGPNGVSSPGPAPSGQEGRGTTNGQPGKPGTPGGPGAEASAEAGPGGMGLNQGGDGGEAVAFGGRGGKGGGGQGGGGGAYYRSYEIGIDVEEFGDGGDGGQGNAGSNGGRATARGGEGGPGLMDCGGNAGRAVAMSGPGGDGGNGGDGGDAPAKGNPAGFKGPKHGRAGLGGLGGVGGLPGQAEAEAGRPGKGVVTGCDGSESTPQENVYGSSQLGTRGEDGGWYQVPE